LPIAEGVWRWAWPAGMGSLPPGPASIARSGNAARILRERMRIAWPASHPSEGGRRGRAPGRGAPMAWTREGEPDLGRRAGTKPPHPDPLPRAWEREPGGKAASPLPLAGEGQGEGPSRKSGGEPSPPRDQTQRGQADAEARGSSPLTLTLSHGRGRGNRVAKLRPLSRLRERARVRARPQSQALRAVSAPRPDPARPGRRRSAGTKTPSP
jgi:hypothetical protein